MKTEYFPELKNTVEYEGKGSKNPLSFKYYNASQNVGNKTMAEHLRFSVAYWHTFMGTGADMFGGTAYSRPWTQRSDPMDRAKDTLEAAFEFITKLGIQYYCFHDRDIAPEGNSVIGSEKNLMELVSLAKEKQAESGIRLLWGTANVFSHPRYMNGAATNPDFNPS